MTHRKKPRLSLGYVSIPKAARIRLNNIDLINALARHSRAEWERSSLAQLKKWFAFLLGLPIDSEFRDDTGTAFRIRTEGDRTFTSVKLI